MAKPVSQSRTMWVKKGTVVDGKKVKKGYVAQYGRPERRVTNRVRLEVKTPKRGKKGDVVRLKDGRYVTKKKKPSTAGGGVTRAQAAAAASRGDGSGSKPKPKPTTNRVPPSMRQEGAGSDGVNANTSSGSAKTSSYVHDSFSSYWNQPRRIGTARGNKYMTGRKIVSYGKGYEPKRGEKKRLQKMRDGNYRWVKVV